MKRNIKIFEIDGSYCFTVGTFSSLNHHHLTKHAKAAYPYAWQAHKAARRIVKKSPYHLEVCNRYAIEDMMAPVIDTISAENRLVDHYKTIYDGLVDTAESKDREDEDQNKVNYQEAKAVVAEILFIKDNLDQDEQGDEEEKAKSKEEFDVLVSKISKLVRSHYKKELDEDVKKSEEEPAPPQGDMSMEGMEGMEGMGEGMPMEGMGGGMPMGGEIPLASVKNLLKKVSHSNVLDKEVREDFLDEYGSRACQSIEVKHPSATYKIASEDGDIIIVEGDKKLVYLDVDKDLILENISPLKDLKETHPFESLEFYQAYWKPICEAVGHCSVGDRSFVVCPEMCHLPDIPHECPKEYLVSGIHKNSGDIRPINVAFRGDDPSWFIEPSEIKTATSVSRYTEEEYLENGKGAMVMCNDETLPSYHGKTGQVVQVIPLDEYLEVDIDFGNHIVRMVETQFKKINEL